MNWDKLYPAAYMHFGCEYLSPDVCSARKIGEKQLRKRHKEQSEIWSELKILERICESGSLPAKATLIELRRQKAVEGLSPIMAWITWQVVKTLAIKVIEWLWDQYAEQQKMSGAST
jgi:hypothetical protein